MPHLLHILWLNESQVFHIAEFIAQLYVCLNHYEKHANGHVQAEGEKVHTLQVNFFKSKWKCE